MKKPRWKAVLRAYGYRYKKEWDFWGGKNLVILFSEEIRKDHIIDSVNFINAPACEWCKGSGMEITNGWYHGCTGCEATGKNYIQNPNNRLEKRQYEKTNYLINSSF